jgi:hypothetical protein
MSKSGWWSPVFVDYEDQNYRSIGQRASRSLELCQLVG